MPSPTMIVAGIVGIVFLAVVTFFFTQNKILQHRVNALEAEAGQCKSDVAEAKADAQKNAAELVKVTQDAAAAEKKAAAAQIALVSFQAKPVKARTEIITQVKNALPTDDAPTAPVLLRALDGLRAVQATIQH